MPEDKKPDENKPKVSNTKGERPDIQIPVRPIPIPRPPIFVNPSPTISSLSPVGAVVNGSDFPLSVFGSNFNANLVVNWNKSPRPTTFISPTQVTAQIASADIATIGPVSVTVSSPTVPPPPTPPPTPPPPTPPSPTPTVVSNSVTFNVIPDINAIISQLQAISQNPSALLGELGTWVTLEQAQVDAATTRYTADESTIATDQGQIQNLNTTIAQQQTTISQLQAALAAAKGASASPMDVAQSFKTVLDTIQQQARDAGGVQTTLTNMNIQLKTLISVQPQTGTTPPQAVLSFPDPTAPPDPNLLSTMTLAFGAIPNVKPASSVPPTPAPTPAPSVGIRPAQGPAVAAGSPPVSSSAGNSAASSPASPRVASTRTSGGDTSVTQQKGPDDSKLKSQKPPSEQTSGKKIRKPGAS